MFSKEELEKMLKERQENPLKQILETINNTMVENGYRPAIILQNANKINDILVKFKWNCPDCENEEILDEIITFLDDINEKMNIYYESVKEYLEND